MADIGSTAGAQEMMVKTAHECGKKRVFPAPNVTHPLYAEWQRAVDRTRFGIALQPRVELLLPTPPSHRALPPSSDLPATLA